MNERIEKIKGRKEGSRQGSVSCSCALHQTLQRANMSPWDLNDDWWGLDRLCKLLMLSHRDSKAQSRCYHAIRLSCLWWNYYIFRVIYFSIHRYEYGLFWPNLRESDYDYIGDGNGRGFNINVPFNKVNTWNFISLLTCYLQVLSLYSLTRWWARPTDGSI